MSRMDSAPAARSRFTPDGDVAVTLGGGRVFVGKRTAKDGATDYALVHIPVGAGAQSIALAAVVTALSHGILTADEIVQGLANHAKVAGTAPLDALRDAVLAAHPFPAPEPVKAPAAVKAPAVKAA